MITLIVARDRNGAIGRGGDIPWRASEDLRMFKRETADSGLVMGRRTWESLPKKPLPGRLNCVVSRDRSAAETVVGDVASAVRACRDAGYLRVYGVGGEGIYREMLPIADRLLITEVDLEVEGADAWFPDFDETAWAEVHRATIRDDDPKCVVRELLRTCAPTG